MYLVCMFRTPEYMPKPGNQYQKVLLTLQNAPLERPTCFAFPKQSSSRLNYYQPTGYHLFHKQPCAAEYVGHAWCYVINASAQVPCLQ